MARKTGSQYADEVRALREAGFDFPASAGYRLVDAANWSAGQKSAVTRAFNRLDDAAERRDVDIGDDEPRDTNIDVGDFFDDAAGDADEEWSDIDFLDFDDIDVFIDAESDSYGDENGN